MITLDKWKKLDFDEKLNIIHKWYPLNKPEKGALQSSILKEFLHHIDEKDRNSIKRVELGREGLGDALFLFVILKKGKKIRLPQVYDDVFPVQKKYE